MYVPMVNPGATEGPMMTGGVVTGGVVMAGGPTGTYQYTTYTGQVGTMCRILYVTYNIPRPCLVD